MLGLLQIPAAHTFVLDGVLMGGNDFRDLRWSTTIAFLISLPVFVAVMAWPDLGLVGVWTGMLLWVSVRALKNHLRVRGEIWMRSADSVA